jgi:hypothetical protein
MIDIHEKRGKEPEMEKKTKEAKKIKPDNVERVDKVWDLVSDLNPY